MSLIIGRVNNNKVYILGDTALTYDDYQKVNPLTDGCLKQYIITDTLAIAFAGDSLSFQDACPKLFSALEASEIVDIAIKAQKNGADFELLIGEIGYENIRIIRDCSMTESTVGWIGDETGFKAFQKFFHSSDSQNVELNKVIFQGLKIPEPITENEIYCSLYKAFKKVIIEGKIRSIGGLTIPLCSDKDQFRYLNYTDVTSDLLDIKDLKDTPTLIKFGTAEKGGYCVEFCDDSMYGGQGKNIGYYFLQGGFGIVFQPNQFGFKRPQIVYAESPAYWVLETKKLLGYGIGSGYLTANDCGIAGEKLLNEGNDQDALFCYELGKDNINLKPAVLDRYIAGYATAMFNSDINHQPNAINMLQQFIVTHPVSSCCKNTLDKILQIKPS